MAFSANIRCSECDRPLVAAVAVRRQRGLRQRSPYTATCSDHCEERRGARFRREARERGFRLEAGDWRCEDCGCTAEEAVERRAREGRSLPAGAMVVCSAECRRARNNRRKAALTRVAMRETQEQRRGLRRAAPRGRSS